MWTENALLVQPLFRECHFIDLDGDKIDGAKPRLWASGPMYLYIKEAVIMGC